MASLIALAGKSGARLLDAASGRELARFFEYGQDGKTVAFGRNGSCIYLCHEATGLERRTLRREGGNLVVGPREALDESPGFRIGGVPPSRDVVALVSKKSDQVKLLRLGQPGEASPPALDLPKEQISPILAAFSPDGCTVITGSDGSPRATGAHLWDVATGKKLRDFGADSRGGLRGV